MNRRAVGVVLTLATLALVCFSRLAVDPTALLVDADHPSVDHARPLDDSSIGNDLTRLFLPHHLAIARSIHREGKLPQWDDRGFGGRPLVGNPQAGLFYPPTWMVWWTNRPEALGWLTVGHLVFAGLGTYLLARTLSISGWGSLVAAGCFQASPYVLGQTFEGHYPHVWAACWSPWTFRAAIRLYRGEPHSRPILAAILAAAFLTGHPQEAYYLLIALTTWTAFNAFIALRASQIRAANGLVVSWLAILLLMIGLVGIEWIPDLLAQEWTLRGAKITARVASRYHLHPINFLQLLSPRALGGPADYFGHENYWEALTSIGLIPLFLAAIAVAWSRDRRCVRGWLILVVLSVWFASGHKLGLFATLFSIVPGMDRFRVPARSLFLASLGAAMLAGLGVEALRNRMNDDKSWSRLTRRFGLLAAILTILVLSGRWLADQQADAPTVLHHPVVNRQDRASKIRPANPSTEFHRALRSLARIADDPIFWLALGVVPSGLAIAARCPQSRERVAIVLGLLGLVELGIHGHRLLKTASVDRFYGPDPISQTLAKAQLQNGLGSSRIRAVDTLYDDLRAERDELFKTNVNDSFQIQQAADLYRSLYDLFDANRFRRGASMDQAVADYRREVRQAVLDRMAVAWLINDRVDRDFSWPLIASGDWNGSTFAIYQNPTALPRAYVVPRAEVAPDDRWLIDRFRNSDPRQSVLMANNPFDSNQTQGQAFTPADWASTDPDRILLKVETKAPGLLVVADTGMPGWDGTIDGQPTPILRGNRCQRVIPILKPGQHQVVMTYQAPGLTLGLAMTISSLAFIVSWVLVDRFRLREQNFQKVEIAVTS